AAGEEDGRLAELREKLKDKAAASKDPVKSRARNSLAFFEPIVKLPPPATPKPAAASRKAGQQGADGVGKPSEGKASASSAEQAPSSSSTSRPEAVAKRPAPEMLMRAAMAREMDEEDDE
ncbi:unnamed protein product, partial [Polarella glacialis]